MSVQVNSYQWKGMDGGGNRIRGRTRAVDESHVLTDLAGQGIEVISIKISAPAIGFSFGRGRVKRRDIVLFARYLSTLISAGMPILQAFDIIARNEQKPAMQSLVLSIRENVAAGKTLSESFRLYPGHFSELFCSLVSVGERSGTIEKILKKIAAHMESAEKIRGKVTRASIYPAMVISVAVIVSLVLLIFVVPQFQEMFSSVGAKLPYMTRVVIQLSDALRHHFIYIAVAVAGLVWGFRYSVRHNKAFAEAVDRAKLRPWVVGPLLRKAILARYTGTLAITLEAGLPIVDAMTIMEGVVDNIGYKKAIHRISEMLSAGHSLVESMESVEGFPDMIIQMISVGESSGTLPGMLTYINEYYEDEINSTIENLGSIIEPLIIVVLGIIVGTFVIAMYLPIFKLGSIY